MTPRRKQVSNLEPLILTVDDDPHLLALIEHHMAEWGYAHAGACSSAEMWAEIDRAIPAAILLDVALGDTDGVALVTLIRERMPSVPIIMITGHATVAVAVKSLKNGAYDFLCKPLDFDRLHIEIDKAVRQNRLVLEVQALRGAAERTDFHGMVGRSGAMREVYRLVETVGPTDAAVLILGETGTGKELAARAIHACSQRCQGPFVAVNAPAIPHELIESALFGHEKGAFTGAHQTHIGYCEQANGGTLFLDEICEMDYEVQAKLLRFLQDHVVQRVGASSGQAVDVRVVAATNRDPTVQIQNRRLREDFYYRLSVVSISLAPLRERTGDIGLLIHHFLRLAAAKYGRKMSLISSEAMRRLRAYDWPGNIRQLENFIRQVVIMHDEAELTTEMLPSEVREATQCLSPQSAAEAPAVPHNAIPSIPEMERHLILEALELTSGSISEAAKHLGLSVATLYRKIKKYGIARTFSDGR